MGVIYVTTQVCDTMTQYTSIIVGIPTKQAMKWYLLSSSLAFSYARHMYLKCVPEICPVSLFHSRPHLRTWWHPATPVLATTSRAIRIRWTQEDLRLGGIPSGRFEAIYHLNKLIGWNLFITSRDTISSIYICVNIDINTAGITQV